MADRGEGPVASAQPALMRRIWLWALLAILALSVAHQAKSWGRAGEWPGLLDQAEYDGIASTLARTGRYLSPAHGVPSGKYAVRPPGYPAFLAGLYLAAARVGIDRGVLVRGVQLGLTLGVIVMIYLLGAQSGRRAPGLLGAFLYAVYPAAADAAMLCLRETVLSFLTIALALGLTAGFRRGRARAFVAAGIVLGAVTLVRTGTTMLPLLVVALLPFRFGWRRFRTWALAVGFVVALGAVVSPWAARNWVVFGRPVPLSSLNGLSLWVGNYLPYKGMTRDGSYPMIARIVAGQPDEMAADAYLTRVALRRIAGDLRRHPTAFLRMLMAKAERFWEYWDAGELKVSSRFQGMTDAAQPLLLLLGTIGVGVALVGMRVYLPAVLVILYTFGVQMITICEGGRFNFPIMPLVAVLAGVGLDFLFPALRRADPAADGPGAPPGGA